MPATRVVIFCEADGSAPFMDWFAGIPDHAKDKVVLRLRRLRELGNEIRRPEGDYLRDGIYELRASAVGVHYRVLYFFHGRVGRKQQFESAPAKHTREVA